jgi:hypothetical protein
MEARISSIEGSWILECAELMRVTDQPVRESNSWRMMSVFHAGEEKQARPGGEVNATLDLF